ncbi:MAG TPA: hypothetical protein VFH27_14780 [Longimicrobiaceae bacterium]|nr:hypothetical protein [Longimicrobiaceae bacterium]
MDSHVRTLGWIYIASGALSLCAAALVFVVMAGAGIASGDRDAALITSGVGVVVAAFLGVMALPSLITGYGLLNFSPWARIAGIVLSVLHLPGFPIGTMIGGYGLWVLLNEECAERFRGVPAF